MRARKLRISTLTAALAGAGLLATAGFASAQGISDDVIRIGLITDMSGVYSDVDGPGGADAIRMAIADAGGEIDGKKIELLVADHQNKADVASARAREWFDENNIDMLVGGTNSATNLAMANVATEKKRPFIAIGGGTSDLTNAQCSPYTVHYAYDTSALARGTGSAVVKNGGTSWFFLTTDYAFGHALERDTMKVVKAAGGEVKGSVRAPLATADFSSYLLQAQASGAKILGLANAGGDTINSIKAANEFGVTQSMNLAGLLVFITDVHALGLEATKGMYLTTGWFWNITDEARAWSKKFIDKVGRPPTMIQGADYSAVSFYLKGVKESGTDDGDALMKWMKSNRISDFYTKDGFVRPEDGRMIYDMHLVQVKTPQESKEPWDYYKAVQTLPGKEIFTPLSESTCPLLKK